MNNLLKLPCAWVLSKVPKDSPHFCKLLIINYPERGQLAVGWKMTRQNPNFPPHPAFIPLPFRFPLFFRRDVVSRAIGNLLKILVPSEVHVDAARNKDDLSHPHKTLQHYQLHRCVMIGLFPILQNYPLVKNYPLAPVFLTDVLSMVLTARYFQGRNVLRRYGL